MIYIDYRAGSKELIAPLLKEGLPVEETTLEFGDLMWEGRGEGGKPVTIGVEFKQLGELVASLRSQRLQGYQLKGMRNIYDYSYLLYEGELLYDHTGGLLRRKGKRAYTSLPGQMGVSELLKRLYVLHLRGGLNPIYTVTRGDTLQAISALYHTWNDQDLDKHKSHLGIYVALSLIPVSALRRTLSTFPHIGFRMSLAVERQFGSLSKAVKATPEQWAEILSIDDKGKQRRLGMKAALDIQGFLND